MSVNKVITITSSVKQANNAKISDRLDLSLILLYDIYVEYYEFSKGYEKWKERENKCIEDKINTLRMNNPDIICQYKTILPLAYNKATGDNTSNIPGDEFDNTGDSPVAPVVTDFTVSTTTGTPSIGFNSNYDFYRLSEIDLLANYSDNNNDDFSAVIIDLNTLAANFSLVYENSSTSSSTGSTLYSSTDAIELTIPKEDISDIVFITLGTTPITTHTVDFQLIDDEGVNLLKSNVGTITFDRSGSTAPAVGNQAATIGDRTVVVNNRAVTTFTLADFTTLLSPPYNDPEGDLIDAIRFDEISTTNRGSFLLNGSLVTVNQVVIREDIDAGLLTHESADQNDIWSDTFSFSARDEGSQIWVS